MFSQESDIVKTMRLVEGLKAALISHIGQLYGALAFGAGQARKELLAALIADGYVLGKRLGVDFDELDEAVRKRADACADSSEIENRFGDYSRLSRYLEKKR